MSVLFCSLRFGFVFLVRLSLLCCLLLVRFVVNVVVVHARALLMCLGSGHVSQAAAVLGHRVLLAIDAAAGWNDHRWNLLRTLLF